ncbi:unnamed protein product [Rotaria magnacalcarata]|uniref:Uncharacterized protein n=1 Tax=Rotaria magnacalcarata TaxID=392030 RepID=A0A816PY48_9BILA|nr:unnamed protein product [Rotaria magnacalcarata]CAF2053151.1 unnamed protein product [Rotaria magnacalcarata]
MTDDNAFDTLRKNALSSVRYAEFYLPSCNTGSNDSIRIGKDLASSLGTYTLYLQTLRLWQPDDFPWTSLENISIFEYDLSQLLQQLKQFSFLDIYDRTDRQKIELYRSMVHKRFPNSRLNIQTTRFCLWF